MRADRILAVDDELHVRELCREVLEADGYQVDVAETAADALERLQQDPYDLVLTDLKMPRESGIDLLRAARKAAVDVPFVLLTGYPSIETAVEAVREGAEDFLPKPFSKDHLARVVRRVLERRRGERRNGQVGPGFSGTLEPPRLIGRSRAVERLRELIRRAAPTESNVLILGESGTGKELVARSLHILSPRRLRAFVPLDCAAVPEDLIESELLGHEEGAFAGAVARRPGLIESAAGGTLFLDKIGDLSPRLQAKLLRVLEEGKLRRVGGREWLPVDVRVVAATQVDLPAAVGRGQFREDLYFRLNVIPVAVPPLRERSEDIPLLVEAFLAEFAGCRPDPPRQLAPAAQEALLGYPWPGNVRELRNTIERMVSLATTRTIELQDAPAEIVAGGVPPSGDEAAASHVAFRRAKRLTVDRFEREYLHCLLTVHGGNVTRSAREAGMKRSAFQRLMRKHQLSSRGYRQAACTAAGGGAEMTGTARRGTGGSPPPRGGETA